MPRIPEPYGTLSIRVSPWTLREIQDAARASGVSVSSWVRIVVHNHLHPDEPYKPVIATTSARALRTDD